MTQINAYLTFDGNCREAMTFYKDCLGGELMLQTVEGSPVAAQMPPDAGQNILHASLTKGALALMASDQMCADPLVHGNSVTLSLNCSSDAEIQELFSKLSAGGQITFPLADQFWGATFGTLTDKFGTHWMLNYDKAPTQNSHPLENPVSQAKAELLRTKEQMLRALATTPSDKLQWAPSPTARTPLQLVGHSAISIPGIHGLLVGKPFSYAGTAEMDAALRIADKEFTTRDQVISLLEQHTAEYLAWLDTLTPEQLAATIQMPFGSPVPLAVGITFPAYHLSAHTAQLNYIQTIYGDRDWHLPSQNQ